MAKLYEEIPIDQAYKNEFHDLRKVFNDFLDAPAITTVVKITASRHDETYLRLSFGANTLI